MRRSTLVCSRAQARCLSESDRRTRKHFAKRQPVMLIGICPNRGPVLNRYLSEYCRRDFDRHLSEYESIPDKQIAAGINQ